mmetsp:Transcript_10796/g.16581  ORF Transcript_10796/g.16581 Transcript_10796/m.16581 type:complete len:294 (+) Transcript_10796:103-984(+)|eukprot:CAMPEP_0178919968 /NCGR_PEP_ID=MMETSP0786-20121207/14738_1 /TAXON_ID=186022 /ORGANISM="Thalassionema frauenfeldii, Strain CCMP 1798" /LENGTH=293 /DNA_ID=CAMNT_0020593971 /DNA_START=59 /DNA_END=940 /DNA_ORIENTATION=+
MKLSLVLWTLLVTSAAGQEDVHRQLRGLAETTSANMILRPESLEAAMDAGVPMHTLMQVTNAGRQMLNSVTETPNAFANDNGTSDSSAGRALKGKKVDSNVELKEEEEPAGYKIVKTQQKPYLSNRATIALSKAVLSAFRDPNGNADPQLIQSALEQGVPMETFVNSLTSLYDKKKQQLLKSIEVTTRKLAIRTKTLGDVESTTDFVEPTALPNEAIQALARAVLSGLRNNGEMDPKLVKNAIAKGASQELIDRVMAMTRKDTGKTQSTNEGESESEKNDMYIATPAISIIED